MTDGEDPLPGQPEGSADTETTGGQESAPSAEATPADGPAPRSRRRTRLREVADEALEGRGHLMSADPAQARIRATFTGHGVESDRVDAETFGDSVRKLARLFTSLTESRPQVFALGFGNSVVIEIGAPEDEVERASKALAEAERVESPEQRERLIAQALPETTLAAYATRDLFEASEVDVVGASLSYGTQVTDAYKAFVRTLAEDDLSLRLSLPSGSDPSATQGVIEVELSSEEAQTYKEALTAVGDDEVLHVRAVGILAMADSGSRTVRLTLDRNAPKEPALRNHRTVTARYSGRAHREIKEQGLWDQEVVAEFEMTRDRRGTTAHLRRPTFLLLGARRRYD
jgi:hypothetical protein